MSDSNSTGPRSIPPAAPGFTVEDSPLNPVKRDLLLILVAAVLLLLVHDRLVDGLWSQLALLAGAGLAGLGWLWFRVRRVLKAAGDAHG